jgi:REP element-mobilizing transposase RayT
MLYPCFFIRIILLKEIYGLKRSCYSKLGERRSEIYRFKRGMKMENRELSKRKSIRLKHYDYSQAGYYFVTICTENRLNLFGEVVGVDDPVHPPVMQRNKIGEIVCECWNRMNGIYQNVVTDEFCLMPNHIHGIIVISETVGQGRPTLQKIMQGFKSVTTRMCFEYGYTNIWQKSYYEHIIRNEKDLNDIREYIVNNPGKWREDEYFI